uniref:Uncharacterized protein n=1 Tax=Kuetzingia canaliculata TaxID=228262 RepID=A0A1Z1MNV0_KUECA|nr:hypothetical protein [Kuetzingia canaliculata]ARW67770.1 hypothetical protein [Kuetzingia canaliculata]
MFKKRYFILALFKYVLLLLYIIMMFISWIPATYRFPIIF